MRRRHLTIVTLMLAMVVALSATVVLAKPNPYVLGSNNNRPTTLPDGMTVGNQQEYEARNAANLAWLEETFDEAEASGSPAVMLVIQANPLEGDTAEPSGFTEIKAKLEEETIAFGKPVVWCTATATPSG